MELALRCPVYKHKWKDCVIVGFCVCVCLWGITCILTSSPGFLDKMRAHVFETGLFVHIMNVVRVPLTQYCLVSRTSQALLDNLAGRNRKCPTCRTLYSKEDILPVLICKFFLVAFLKRVEICMRWPCADIGADQANEPEDNTWALDDKWGCTFSTFFCIKKIILCLTSLYGYFFNSPASF